MKSQIKDDSVPYETTSKERDFHRKMQLDIAQFKLTKPSDYYSSNIGERPYGVMDFSDTALIEKPGRLLVEGILDNGFKVSGIDFEGPVIIFPSQVFMWDVYNAEDIRSHNFELINFLKPRPGNLFLSLLSFPRLHRDRDRQLSQANRPNSPGPNQKLRDQSGFLQHL